MDRIINTNQDNCTGCNKCIMVCPVKYANDIKITSGERKVKVERTRCIGCGNCLKICNHNARSYTEDSEKLFFDLANGEKISIIIAPSFVPNQFEKYKNIIGYLKKAGANLVYDAALGGDITTWAHVQFVKKEKKEDFLISQPCPPIVNYIEKYAPNLIKNLSPIQSPVMASAIYIKKYLNITDKMALISPCIAKKNEIERSYNAGLINYNISFEKLLEYFQNQNIDINSYEERDFDNPVCGLGMLFSRPGRLKENILYHMPDLKVKELSGSQRVYEIIDYLNNGNSLGNIDLYDFLSCSNGCNVGPVSCKKETDAEISIEVEKEILNIERLEKLDQRKVDYEKYNELFEYFDRTLNLDDFKVYYEDKTDLARVKIPTEEELNQAYLLLKKNSKESRKINCYSCGYKTCKDMAIAIINGFNHPESCYQYNRIGLESEKKAIEDNNNYITNILEHLSEPIIITNKEGLIIFANKRAEKILGCNSFQYSNRHINSFINGIEIKNLKELTTYEFDFERGINNCAIKLEYSSIDYKNKKSLIFIIEDVTSDNELNSLKSNFVSMLKLELLTPLISIRDSIRLISSGAFGTISDTTSELLNIAGNNSTQLVNVINNVLDLEKIKSDKMDFKYNEYNVNSLIKESIELNQKLESQYNINFTTKNNSENCYVKVDKERFLQVLSNLLSNAAKFSTPYENVEVEICKEKELISIFVRNKGIGIPEENYSKIFESFYRIDGIALSKKWRGGLGLSISKLIVKKMNGSIGFNSIPNDTTTFYISFPEVHKKTDQNTAIIVEDNKTIAFGIKTMLKRLNIESDIATSCQEAQELLKAKTYNLMTLDIMLPDRNGLELLDDIRENRETKDLPVIVISSSPQEKLKVKESHNIACWLEKNFDTEALQSTVSNVFKNKLLNKIHILHVENDNSLVEVIRSNLSEVAEITNATTIKEAQKLITEKMFEIIILDYSLPDGTSDILINEIYKSINKETTLILFSAFEISEYISTQVDATILKSNVSNEQFCESLEKYANNCILAYKNVF